MKYILNNFQAPENSDINSKIYNINNLMTTMVDDWKVGMEPTLEAFKELIGTNFDDAEKSIARIVKAVVNPDFQNVLWFKSYEKLDGVYRVNPNDKVLNQIFVEKGEDGNVSRVFVYVFTPDFVDKFKNPPAVSTSEAETESK